MAVIKLPIDRVSDLSQALRESIELVDRLPSGVVPAGLRSRLAFSHAFVEVYLMRPVFAEVEIDPPFQPNPKEIHP
jgi:hypothetical protein